MSNIFKLEEQIAVVSTQTLHELFAEDADSVSLYMFYYYTAKWQKTNQPYATAEYCQKGLRWGEQRFYKAKRVLKKYNLVEDIKSKNKWYIKINYLWKQGTCQKATTPPNSSTWF